MRGKRPNSKRGDNESLTLEPQRDLIDAPFESDADFLRLILSAADYALKKFAIDVASDSGNDSVLSVADMIRLAQFRRELKADEPIRKVEVRWVDHSVTDFSK